MALLTISYFLNVADYFFTMYWVHLFGIEAEANPFGRWMLENGIGGFVKIVAMAGLFFLLSTLIKRCPRAKIAGHIVFGAYSAITLCHLTLAVALL